MISCQVFRRQPERCKPLRNMSIYDGGGEAAVSKDYANLRLFVCVQVTRRLNVLPLIESLKQIGGYRLLVWHGPLGKYTPKQDGNHWLRVPRQKYRSSVPKCGAGGCRPQEPQARGAVRKFLKTFGNYGGPFLRACTVSRKTS